MQIFSFKKQGCSIDLHKAEFLFLFDISFFQRFQTLYLDCFVRSVDLKCVFGHINLPNFESAEMNQFKITDSKFKINALPNSDLKNDSNLESVIRNLESLLSLNL